jgi:hypothetical protein
VRDGLADHGATQCYAGYEGKSMKVAEMCHTTIEMSPCSAQ